MSTSSSSRGLAADREGLAWQIGVWDRISQIYLREIDKRFEPVVEQLIARAALAPGQHVLDLGTGTWLGRDPRGIFGWPQGGGERR